MTLVIPIVATKRWCEHVPLCRSHECYMGNACLIYGVPSCAIMSGVLTSDMAAARRRWIDRCEGSHG